jgi:hypothetical protein
MSSSAAAAAAAAAVSISLLPPPPGWLDVPEASAPVGKTRLLLMKSPLSRLKWNVRAAHSFTPQQMLQQQRKEGRRIKYLIQVGVKSATQESDRAVFVDPKELQSDGCTYLQYHVDLNPAASTSEAAALDPRARPFPITETSVTKFVTLLSGLLTASEAEEEKESKESHGAAAAASSSLPSYIAVCDVYGYNLCGMLLCCFLVDSYGLDVKDALSDIGDARPPGIYVSSLLQALLSRSYEPTEEEMAGGMQAAVASGHAGNRAIARLTCIPLVPQLPKPDWHQLSWTWNGNATLSAVAAPLALTGANGKPLSTEEIAMAAAASAPAGEEFKRKVRKKAVTAIASSSTAAAAAAAAAPTAAPTAASSSPSGVSRFPSVGSESPAAKRAKVETSVAAPSPAASAAAVSSNGSRSRSPQPIFHVTAAAAASSSSNGAAASSLPDAISPDQLAAQIQRLRSEHSFLQLVSEERLPPLQAALAQLMPSASVSKFKLHTSSVWNFLHPPLLTAAVLQQVLHAPPASRAPYLLSWLPQHMPCLLLILRESVYAVFHEQLFFLVPHLRFPKRKAPHEFVNNTLLLGELIVDSAPASSGALSLQSRFLVTDLLIMSQTMLLSLMGLEQRLSTAENELIAPYKSMLAAAAPGSPHSQLHVRVKPFSPLNKLESVLHMQVPHVHEGIVLRMSGKDKEAARSAGYQFVWRKVSA